MSRTALLHKRAFSSGRCLLSPNTSPVPPPMASNHFPPSSISKSPPLAFSSHSSSFHSTRNSIDVKRCCYFSSQALADLTATGIVDVPLAQTGEGIAECEVLKWFVQEGDLIEEFQPLCEVQSDKATIEITSRYKGKVDQVLFVPGDIVKVGETLLKMVVEQSHISTKATGNLETKNPLPEVTKTFSDEALATPAVRNLAKEYGININNIPGTGKEGRVLKEDVLRYAVQGGHVEDSSTVANLAEHGVLEKYVPATLQTGNCLDDKTILLRGFQRAMVKSMSLAAKVPHFHYVDEINCDALIKLKTTFQNSNSDPDVKHTFLPLLIKSLSMAMSKYPMMNSCFNEDSLEVILKGLHNIGIAMATPYGLVVPTIKNVQSLTILEITKELSRLQQSSLDNKLSPEDISGGTITLSNIGAIGGKFGSPILNLPEVSIIAVGCIQKVAQYSDDGNLYPASQMTVNIGADHRVLDGATVARFCNEWKQYIQKPELLMLHLR